MIYEHIVENWIEINPSEAEKYEVTQESCIFFYYCCCFQPDIFVEFPCYWLWPTAWSPIPMTLSSPWNACQLLITSSFCIAAIRFVFRFENKGVTILALDCANGGMRATCARLLGTPLFENSRIYCSKFWQQWWMTVLATVPHRNSCYLRNILPNIIIAAKFRMLRMLSEGFKSQQYWDSVNCSAPYFISRGFARSPWLCSWHMCSQSI